jgi:hypothetical protein
MTARGYKFSNIDLYRSDAKNFVVDHETKSLIPPFSAIDGLGEAAARTVIEARKDGEFLSIEDLTQPVYLFNVKHNVKPMGESFEDEHLGSTERTIDDAGEIIPDSVEPGPAAGLATELNKLIRDEWEAIQGYNDAIVMAELEGFHDVAKVFKDIVNEENVHVGQLEQCMKLVSPNADSIVHGEIEAEGQLGEEPAPVEKEEDPEEGMHY